MLGMVTHHYLTLSYCQVVLHTQGVRLVNITGSLRKHPTIVVGGGDSGGGCGDGGGRGCGGGCVYAGVDIRP